MQQLTNPSTGQIVIIIWFALSIFIAVVGTVVLRLWLPRLGVKLISGLAGTPGYMEFAYLKWCRKQGRRPKIAILVFRAASLINALAAGVFFILTVTQQK